MGIHMMRMANGFVHYSTTDAIFRTIDGRPVVMEFHRFCGPMFSLEDNDGGWMPDEGSEEWDNLWPQFDGWWNAKGKKQYLN